MAYLYLYFSGTGNTKYVVERFSQKLKDNAEIVSIEHQEIDYISLIQSNDHITFAYPIYESMMPPIMTDFIQRYQTYIKGKHIGVIVTQLLFSGDGASLLTRQLKKDNTIAYTVHINMPNNLTDLPLFRPKTDAALHAKIEKANAKIDALAEEIIKGKTIRMGRTWYAWFLGFFTQRLYAKGFYKGLRKKLKVNHDRCIQCKKCINLCPVDNLSFDQGKIKTHDQCTLCYRCINACPTRALSLFTKHGPKKQYIRDSYN